MQKEHLPGEPGPDDGMRSGRFFCALIPRQQRWPTSKSVPICFLDSIIEASHSQGRWMLPWSSVVAQHRFDADPDPDLPQVLHMSICATKFLGKVPIVYLHIWLKCIWIRIRQMIRIHITVQKKRLSFKNRRHITGSMHAFKFCNSWQFRAVVTS